MADMKTEAKRERLRSIDCVTVFVLAAAITLRNIDFPLGKDLLAGLAILLVLIDLLCHQDLRINAFTKLLILYGLVYLSLGVAMPLLASGNEHFASEAFLAHYPFRIRLEVLRIAFVVMLALYLGSRTESKLRGIINVSVLLALSVTAIQLLFPGLMAEMGSGIPNPGFRLSLAQQEPSAAVPFWIVMTCGFVATRRRRSLSSWLVAVSFILIGFLTGSKAYVVALAVALPIYTVIKRDKWSIGALAMVVAIGIALYAFWASFSHQVDVLIRFLRVFRQHGLQGLSYEYLVFDSFIIRVGSFAISVFLFARYPFGVGFEGLRGLAGPAADTLGLTSPVVQPYTDSPVLSAKAFLPQHLVETGLIGTMLLGAIIWRVYRSLRAIGDRPMRAFLVSGFVAFCVSMMLVELFVFVIGLVLLYYVGTTTGRRSQSDGSRS